ncbi:N-acetyltransferase [Metasolibacillus meyeri]|uniref:N-acetyltransferase n=1 Tax=Metasolibacillus meyeri TaxID=1071052 RepID=A0AAW9NGY8_9BACL|nr:N-acetyltransferase [Metasolibacillus meyeri]MEC1176957.1 N-acetyltransferase [Metasolibacillus meyeri]
MTKNKQLAQFLALLNNEPAHHIGYCGEDVEEIEQTLREDFTESAFAIAYDNERIVAAIGLDIDGTSAEVWGPFMQCREQVPLLVNMWSQLLEKHSTIHTFQFFINEENKVATEFIKAIGAQQTGWHSVLRWQQQEQPEMIPFTLYEPKFYEMFAVLHNEAFPNTYYDAKTIVQRLNDTHELLLLINEEGQLQGYAYIEVDVLHQWAAIEYIAIAPAFRRQGLGTKLLAIALTRISATHQIQEVQLTVSTANEGALHLYRAAGFIVKHELVSYQLKK